jgi:hypothetical protein
LFHRLTDWEMPGTHDQNVSVTLPPAALVLALPLEDEPPLLQAARAKTPTATATISRRRPTRGARLLELRSEDDMRCYLPILCCAPPRDRPYFHLGAFPNEPFRQASSGIGS